MLVWGKHRVRTINIIFRYPMNEDKDCQPRSAKDAGLGVLTQKTIRGFSICIYVNILSRGFVHLLAYKNCSHHANNALLAYRWITEYTVMRKIISLRCILFVHICAYSTVGWITTYFYLAQSLASIRHHIRSVMISCHIHCQIKSLLIFTKIHFHN